MHLLPRKLVTRALVVGLLGLGLGSCDSSPTICTSYYKQDKLKYEVPCKKGVFEGTYREYNRSGDLWVVKHYVEGVEEDTTRYYYSRTGELLKQVPMLHGQKHGQAVEFYKDGARKRVQQYEQGQRVGEDVRYHEDGQTLQERTTYVANRQEGPYLRQSASGQALVQGQYEAGQAVGTWTHRYANGKVKARFRYEVGQKHGPFEILRANGNFYLKGTYQHGLVSGTVTYFNRAGYEAYTERWRRGKNLDYDPATRMDQQYEENKGGFSDLGQGFRIRVSPEAIEIEG